MFKKHDRKCWFEWAWFIDNYRDKNILLTKTLVDTNANEQLELLCCQVVDVSVQAVVVLVEVYIVGNEKYICVN